MCVRNSLLNRLCSIAILAIGMTLSLRASAEGSGNIVGKVTNSLNKALPGATVVEGAISASSDSNGNYTLASIPSGSRTLTVSLAGYTTASVAVTVIANATVTAPTIQLAAQQASAPPPPPNPGVFKITGVATNLDSVKVRFNPGAGAADYRIYDAANPTNVKYAGIIFLNAPYGYHFLTDSKGNPLIPDQTAPNTATVTTPTLIGVPANEIELNNLTPGTPYTLVIEAVDAVGPVCQGSLYTSGNCALYAQLCPLCQLGGNMGCTADGNMTINGQGAMTNKPKRITSQSIQVTPTGLPSLPTTKAASQVLFETFSSGSITPVGVVDNQGGIERFSMQTPAATWEIRTENADVVNSKVFLMNQHFMDILFDGGTPGTNNPLHQGHGVISLSPVQTVNFSGGQILHLTQEVDTHLGETGRRWVDFRLTPANDPYFAFETTGRINNTDTDLMIQIQSNAITLDEHLGAVTPSDPNSPPIDIRVIGAPGQATFTDGNRPGLTSSGGSSSYWGGTQGFQYGRGLDNRSRLDLFISQTHFAMYEDGVKITEHDLPTPLAFTAAKVYYSHYHYHSAQEVQDLLTYAPWENYWLNVFPYSDERHWDNMGYEVLPSSTSWTALAATVQPPAFK